MTSFTERVIAAIVEHLPLIAGEVVALWWVLKTFGPKLLTAELQAQDVRIDAAMRKMISDHEQVEARNYASVATESTRRHEGIQEKLGDLDDRLARVEERLEKRWLW